MHYAMQCAWENKNYRNIYLFQMYGVFIIMLYLLLMIHMYIYTSVRQHVLLKK